MIIKELVLSSFGKFDDKKVHLSDGMNIIYGENESGKSTIHKFIDGMFFGFFKPYSKRRTYTEDHDKYFPMGKNDYYGILKYEYNNNIYRIERNFVKDNSELNIYDDTTGECITKLFEYDSVTRLHDPASMHMNLNRIVFNNTISIAQLGTKTEDELATEVKDSLTNLGGTLDEDISIKRVMERLDKHINDIGTEKRVKSSPYGKLIDEIAKLEDERKNAKTTMIEIDEYIKNLNDLKAELEVKRILKQKLEYKAKNLAIYERYKMFKKAKELDKDIMKLNEDIELLSNYTEVSTDDYTEIIKANNQLEELQKRKQSEIERSNNLEIDINELKEKSKEIAMTNMGNSMKFDLYNYEEKEMELNKLDVNKTITDLKSEIEELEELKYSKEKNKKISIISGIAAVVFISLGILINIKISLVSVIFLLLSVYFIKMNENIKLEIRKINKYIMDIQTRERELNNKIETIKIELSEVLKKYGVSNKIDLKVKVDELDQNYKISYKYSSLEKQRSEMGIEIDEINEKYKSIEDDMRYILSRNNLKDIEEFKDVINKKDKYNKLTPMFESKKSILENLLKDEDIYELEKEFVEFNIEDYNIDKMESESKEDIEIQVQNMSEDILEKRNEINKVEEKISNLQRNIREIIYIEEEISRKEYEKIKYEEELESLELAKEMIENASKKIRKDFSPKLNSVASNILSSITNDKYKDIKIDEKLNIKVIDTKDRLIDIQNLSSGTIEQIYFATRIGISKVIRQEDKLPLIIDDAFVQYDDNRLINILNFLYRESFDRQVIIFTCQNREREVLNKLSLRYKFIELN